MTAYGKLIPVAAAFLNLACIAAQREEGPFYEAANVLDGPAVQVRKTWMALGSDQVVRKQNFVVPAIFHETGEAGKEGEVRFGRPLRVLDDGWPTWTRVVPVREADLAVQVQRDYQRRVTLSVLDRAGGQPRKLASFVQEPQNPNDGACAITRSGRFVLLVMPDKITIWDVVRWRAEAEVDGSKGLFAVRAGMMKGFGNPGRWWLTDDLRYIVADSTHWTWDALGMGPVSPTPLTAAGLKMDLAKDAVVFDRKTGTLSTFRSEIPELGNQTIADVEDVRGRIALLYKLGPISDLRVAIADTAGHVRASHTIHSFLAELAGWDPQRGEVWFWTRDAHNSLPNVQPDADNHLIAWDVAKDRERRYRIPIAQIRRAVDGGK